MAFSRLSLIRAIVVKDLIALWPLVLASFILPLVIAVYPADTGKGYGAWVVAVGLGVLSLSVLIISLFQQDSAVDPRKDWLTRPIGPANLLVAKGAFIVVTVIAPHYVAAVVAGLFQGHSAGEALLAGWVALMPVLLLVALGAAMGVVTANLIQALLSGMAVLAVFLVWMFMMRGRGGIAIDETGLGWMAELTLFVTGALCLVLAVWFLYRRGKPWISRAILGAGALFIVCNPLQYMGDAAFAWQRGLSPAPGAAEPVELDVGLCNAIKAPGRSNVRPYDFPVASAALYPTGLSEDWVVVADRTKLSYTRYGGAGLTDAPEVLGTEPKFTFLPDVQYWSLPREAALLLAERKAGLRMDADITVLKPLRTATLVIGAPRQHIPGLGYCSAKRSAGSIINAQCFATEAQPAVIVATTPRGEHFNSPVNYGRLFGASYQMRIPMVSMAATVTPEGDPIPGAAEQEQVIRITAYGAMAHAVRSADIDTTKGRPGLLCQPQPGPPAG